MTAGTGVGGKGGRAVLDLWGLWDNTLLGSRTLLHGRPTAAQCLSESGPAELGVRPRWSRCSAQRQCTLEDGSGAERGGRSPPGKAGAPWVCGWTGLWAQVSTPVVRLSAMQRPRWLFTFFLPA